MDMLDKRKLSKFIRFLKGEHIYHMFQTETVSYNCEGHYGNSVFTKLNGDITRTLLHFIKEEINPFIVLFIWNGTKRGYEFWEIKSVKYESQ